MDNKLKQCPFCGGEAKTNEAIKVLLINNALEALTTLRDYVVAFDESWDMDWQNQQILDAITLVERIRGDDNASEED